MPSVIIEKMGIDRQTDKRIIPIGVPFLSLEYSKIIEYKTICDHKIYKNTVDWVTIYFYFLLQSMQTKKNKKKNLKCKIYINNDFKMYTY